HRPEQQQAARLQFSSHGRHTRLSGGTHSVSQFYRPGALPSMGMPPDIPASRRRVHRGGAEARRTKRVNEVLFVVSTLVLYRPYIDTAQRGTTITRSSSTSPRLRGERGARRRDKQVILPARPHSKNRYFYRRQHGGLLLE